MALRVTHLQEQRGGQPDSLSGGAADTSECCTWGWGDYVD
jgi:hypothetical protein